jgi:hypothetical protein
MRWIVRAPLSVAMAILRERDEPMVQKRLASVWCANQFLSDLHDLSLLN